MDDIIVKNISRMIIPFIQLYGIFVIFHGHLSPGGGFPGGAILGASIILYTLAFGAHRGHKKMPHYVSKKLESGAILWYILLGMVGIWTGHHFLTNQAAGFFMGQAGQILSGGFIPFITIAIGIKVGSTMITLFHTMIEEEHDREH
jgi:multicomponent Na+:H+ antiporter subunit B